jgi:cytochrome c553
MLMKKLLAGLVLVFGVANVANAAGDATAGQDKVAVCGGCHGADGNSVMANFPSLAGLGEKYLLKQMNDIKSGKRVVVEMTGLLDAMTEQDLADVAAYFDSKAMAAGVAPADSVEKGQALYRGGSLAKSIPACSACHAPNGAGNELAGFPALAGQHSAYVELQLVRFRTGERSNDGDTRIMRDIAAKLSDVEIKALSGYISGLR